MVAATTNLLFGKAAPETPGASPDPNDSERKELLLEVIKEVYSTKDIELKTELNERQIKAFAKGQLFAERYGVPIMAQLVEKLSIMSVSKGRKGRKEFVEIGKALNSFQADEEEAITMKSRLLGS